MLSIGKLAAGAEDYYLHNVADGREEYYIGAGEAPGTWVGLGAPDLGLWGTVDPASLRAVLAGRHPIDGSDLVLGHGTTRARVAGFDCTFSAPKSVSVLWAMAGPADDPLTDRSVPAGSVRAGTPEVARAVRLAHDRAVGEAIEYLHRHALAARRGSGGAERIQAEGFVGAAFRHRTSRNGDPQLHTHVLLANLCRGSDGRYGALDARLVYFHARTAGFVYQAVLRAELAETLGLRFDAVRQGVAEISGVPQRLLRQFSTRRAQIEAALERHGATSARAAGIAALDTRPKKEPSPSCEANLHDRWRAEAATHDLGFVDRIVGRPRAVQPDRGAGTSLTATLLSPEGLTAQVSAFERRDVVRAVAERLLDGAHLADIDRLADEMLSHADVIELEGPGPGGEGRHTTRELLATEARLLDGAFARFEEGSGAVSEHSRQSAFADYPELSDEQRAMVTQLTRSGHGVDVVVGRAGAGKTTALAAARMAWEADGYTVVGAALSARAAAGLQEGAGIESTTLARVLSFHPPYQLDKRHVLVIDEAGMVGTRDLVRVLDRAETVEAKVVLVGDHRQLPEISAGGSFVALAERLGAVELTANRRQVEEWERASLEELRHGDVSVSLTAYDTHHRLHHAPTMDAARRELVGDWISDRQAGSNTRMLAATRPDVDELNNLARRALRAKGRLGSAVAEVGDMEFALGDRVICLRNDRKLGILNGTFGSVVGRSAGGGLTLLAGDELYHLPTSYLEAGHLTYGYATTIHKSQGETIDRAFVLGGEAMYREAGYVALSRARIRTDLYVPESVFEDGRSETETLDRLSRMLGTSKAKNLAHETAGDDQIAAIRKVLARSEEANRPVSERCLGLER